MWGKKPKTFEMQISKITSGKDFKNLFQIISQVEELYGRSRMEAAQNVMSILYSDGLIFKLYNRHATEYIFSPIKVHFHG